MKKPKVCFETVLAEAEIMLQDGKMELIKWKHRDIEDVHTSLLCISQGTRVAVFENENSTPSEKLVRIFRNDLAKHLAYRCLFDNYQVFKNPEYYPRDYYPKLVLN